MTIVQTVIKMKVNSLTLLPLRGRGLGSTGVSVATSFESGLNCDCFDQ